MLWIGWTGGIASGKSTAAQYLVELGWDVIDADFWAKKALEADQQPYHQTLQAFGPEILLQDGQLDRKKIADIIFNNSKKKLLLESFIHPYIRSKVQELKSNLEAQGKLATFYDVPLLFEKKMETDFDLVVLVYTSRENQVLRMIQRNSWTLDQIEARLKAQLSMEEKKIRSDYVIDNNHSLENLKTKVGEFHNFLQSRLSNPTLK